MSWGLFGATVCLDIYVSDQSKYSSAHAFPIIFQYSVFYYFPVSQHCSENLFMDFSLSKTCVISRFLETILLIQYIYNRDAFSASEASTFKLFPVPCLQHKFLKHCLRKEILQYPPWGKSFSLVLICHQHNLNDFIKHK